MKRFFFALSLLLAVSCGRDGLYISVDNTAWETTEDTKVAWPVFLDGERVSLIQADMSSGLYQTRNGTFAVDGHRVLLTVDGTSLQITRTFSHLKNSRNKNYKRLSPVTPASSAGNLWAGLKDGNLRFLYLSPGGKCMEPTALCPPSVAGSAPRRASAKNTASAASRGSLWALADWSGLWPTTITPVRRVLPLCRRRTAIEWP